MWQMEVWRHISSGRLSELFGSSTLSEDRFIRTLGWRQSAERDLAALSPEARAALDAYAAGVNDWIADHHGSMSLPFVVTALKSGLGGFGGYDLEPWTAVDTLAWQKVQAWQLGGNYDSEVFRMLADLALGDPARTDELFPPYDPSMPVITPSGLKGSGGAGATAAAATADAATDGSSGAIAAAGGTTPGADVRAGRRLARPRRRRQPDPGDGRPGRGGRDRRRPPGRLERLRRRPVEDDDEDGAPRQRPAPRHRHAVGLVHQRPPLPGDQQDLPVGRRGRDLPGRSRRRPRPQRLGSPGARRTSTRTSRTCSRSSRTRRTPNAYLVGDESVPYVVRHETIKVAGGAPVEMDVRSTRDGPILNDVDTRLKDAPPLALRWTATDDVDGTFDAIFHIDTASNFEEFHAAFRTYGAPSQNFVYADVKGHIGYVLPGRIPIRADASDRGDRIRSGSDGKHDWTGTIPFDGPALAARPAERDDRDREQRRGRRPSTRTSSPRSGIPATGRSGSRTCSRRRPPAACVSTEILRSIQMDPTVTRAERVMPASRRRPSRLRPTATARSSRTDPELGEARLHDGLARLHGLRGVRVPAGPRPRSTTSSGRSPASTSGAAPRSRR